MILYDTKLAMALQKKIDSKEYFGGMMDGTCMSLRLPFISNHDTTVNAYIDILLRQEEVRR